VYYRAADGSANASGSGREYNLAKTPMGNFGSRRAVRTVVAGLLGVAALSPRPARAAAPPVLIGTFQQHVIQNGPSVQDPNYVLRTHSDGNEGTFDTSVALSFPASLPAATYDPTGTVLIFSQPFTVGYSVQIDWTTPAADPRDDPKNVFAFSLNHLEVYDDAHSVLAPNCDASLPLMTGLDESTHYTFNQTVSCSISTLPILDRSNPFSPNPSAKLTEEGDWTFFGDSAALPGGFIAGGGPFIESTYLFNPPSIDLTVDHMEVVQTVQDVSNTVPLVADKATVARLFVNFTDAANPPAATVPGVTAKLHGFHGSAELPGSPLSPINPGHVFEVPDPIFFDRDHTNDALNFLLPAAWTDAGDLTLQAIVNPDKTIGETDYGNDSSAPLTIHLSEAALFSVAYLPVCYQDLEHCPSNAVSTFDAMARKLYPTGNSEFLYSPLKVPRWVWTNLLVNEEDGSKLFAFLLRRYALTDSQEGTVFDQLAAWLPALQTEFPLGAADPIWAGSTGRVSYQQDTSAQDSSGTAPEFSDASFTLAHEMGHNLGLRHTDKAAGGNGCGAVDADSDFAAFYTDGLATIHEAGFDTKNLRAVSSTKKDVMSYCSPPGSNIWISPFDVRKLTSGGLKPQAHAASPQASDAVIVTGTAERDGSAGTIDSVDHIALFAPSEPSDPSGNHCLRFEGAGGATLANQCFRLTFEAENHGQSEIHLAREAFAIKAPFPAGTVKIAIVTGGKEIASVSRSAHPPTIAITSPHTGDTWSGSKSVAWNAADADGDPLTFAILTSPDNGATWLPVVTDLETSSYSIESAELSASSQTLLKVLASDGFDTTAATVGPLTVDAQPFLEATPGLDFGSIALTRTFDLSVLLTNRGDKEGHVLSIASDNSEFAPHPLDLPLTIDANGQFPLSVRFAPTEGGSATGHLAITTDDPQHPTLTVLLSGRSCAVAHGRPCVVATPPPNPQPTSGH